jgi:hypothetical protein
MTPDRPAVPYVVRYPWYMKLMALLMLGVVVLAVIPNPRPVAFEIWEHANLVFRLCMLIGAIGIPAGIAEIFFYRLVFSESGIERRSKFLRKEFRPYAEVAGVEYRPESIWQPGFLIITFSDLRKIKIPSGLARLQTVGAILLTYGEKAIMTTARELKR